MKKEEELKTILVLSLAMLILFLIFKVKVFVFICLALLITALFIPKLSLLIAKGWMSFAHFLGRVNTKIIIFLSYYLCLTPIAVLYRIFNRKQVKDFFDKKEKTYFKDINKKYAKKDLEQLW